MYDILHVATGHTGIYVVAKSMPQLWKIGNKSVRTFIFSPVLMNIILPVYDVITRTSTCVSKLCCNSNEGEHRTDYLMRHSSAPISACLSIRALLPFTRRGNSIDLQPLTGVQCVIISNQQ